MATGQKQGPFSQTPIDVSAVSHEIVSPRDAASGLPTGKRQHKPISITMEWGASTPLFLNALVNNENLTSVLIGLLRNGNQVATIKLTNANVSDYVQHGGGVTDRVHVPEDRVDVGRRRHHRRRTTGRRRIS